MDGAGIAGADQTGDRDGFGVDPVRSAPTRITSLMRQVIDRAPGVDDAAYPNRRRSSKQTEQWLTGTDGSSKTIFS